MNKDITQPKWIKGFKEDSFSKLTQTNNEGDVVGFDVSDEGQFTKELYSWLDFEFLTNLSPKEKQAVQLRGNGFSREEIAKEMGIKPNAAKQLIYRAYRKTKEKIGRVRKNQLEKFGRLYE